MVDVRQVTLREVGPRDGLQSLGAEIPTSVKIAIVDALADAGLTRIEAASFVSRRAVPQMADGAAVLAGVRRRDGVSLEALVPNRRHGEAALAASCDGLVFVLAASQTFNERNVRQPIDASLEGLAAVVSLAEGARVPVQATIATSFGCPFEGEVPWSTALGIAHRAVEVGVAEVTFADTTGMANPDQVSRFVELAVADPDLASISLGWHFHNTRGMGLANVLAAVRAGADQFDASVGGIGGCPFAPSATGNICTEDTAHMLTEVGISTGLDVETLVTAARRIESLLGIRFPGQVMRAGPRWTRA